MGAEGRYDLQLADNETPAAVATATATPQGEGHSSIQNEQQQQEVWLKCVHTKVTNCIYVALYFMIIQLQWNLIHFEIGTPA